MGVAIQNFSYYLISESRFFFGAPLFYLWFVILVSTLLYIVLTIYYFARLYLYINSEFKINY